MKAYWELATFYFGFLFQRAMTFDSPFADRSVDLYAFEPKVVRGGGVRGVEAISWRTAQQFATPYFSESCRITTLDHNAFYRTKIIYQ